MLEEDTDLLHLTVDIVSAYVANNQIDTTFVAELILAVHGSLASLNDPKPAEADTLLRPAVPIKKSITPDYVVCLEDGLRFKSLARHLRAAYDLTPAQYRERWGLPGDYPMVAPNYSAERSRLARELGLGKQRRKGKAKSEPPPPPASNQGRRKKVT
ncbi:transcriptional regulator [Labrys sp. WJW]|uniref:MucR family transcriptional regulator n=1 Tax=Labrys sp. WJW TaxID=1737983 RepID=UPI000835C3F8|nr:MucR family transcriptional regulator [Labrys sp. WJW]OCC03722.1 transcriptional regulator [Labrys sp. WJW]